MLTQGHHGGGGGCEGPAFYTYDAFVEAASTFPGFGTTGDQATRRRELAAFFAQTSHETTGYCWVKRRSPAAAGGQYYGRGPMQLTHEYNYRRAGDALGLDLVRRPDLVSTDPVVAFKTAVWFWMTPRHGAHKRPSCHAVMTGGWTPSRRDRCTGRLPGYGMTTNIISGGLACGRRHGTPQAQGRDRVEYYKRYCRLLRVRLGRNVACINQKPYGHGG